MASIAGENTISNQHVDTDDESTKQIQAHTTKVLVGSQVFGGMGLVSGYIPAAMLGREITGSTSLGTLAAAMLSVGATSASFPLASLMYRQGRRPGLRLGYLIAAGGGLCGFTAAATGFYPLLLLGVAMIGVGNTTNMSARYAAADLASEKLRGRSIGMIVWATTIGSASGSYVALAGATWVAVYFALPDLAGPYFLSSAVFLVSAFVIHLWLRPDPLVVAGGLRTSSRSGPNRGGLIRSVGLITANSNARIAVGAMVTSQMVMVGVMTTTPLHMEDGNQTKSAIGLMMTLHILGMYAFSPVIGWMSDRYGRLPMIVLAGITLVAGSEVAAHTSAHDATGAMLGLFLIGLGWGFGVIAGSALLTESFPISDRVGVQGAADLTMSAFGAIGGLSSGVIVTSHGYGNLSHTAAIFTVVLLVATVVKLITDWRKPVSACDTASDPGEDPQLGQVTPATKGS